MAIQGAIFDLDGTLLDSMHLWVGTGARYAQSIGLSPTAEDRDAMNGMMLDDMSAYILDHFSVSLTQQQLIDGINKSVEYGYFHEVQPKPTTFDVLNQLSAMGVRMCLATATERYLTEAVLRRTGLSRYFDRIFTAGEYHTTKYRPEIFHMARKWLGTPLESTYVFEDTYASIRGAKDGGYKVIAVEDRWAEPRREEIQALADIYLKQLGDLDFTKL